MKNYLLAENLKHKHAFLKKFIILAPLLAVFSAFLFIPAYFSMSAYNWWYIIFLPAVFALIPAMMYKREAKKLNFKALYSLNVNLKNFGGQKYLLH